MRTLLLSLTVLLAGAASLPAQEKVQPKPNTLTPKEIADGWISLFDGETTFGWKVTGHVKKLASRLGFDGGTLETTAHFGPCEVEFDGWEYSELQWGKGSASLTLNGKNIGLLPVHVETQTIISPGSTIKFTGAMVALRNIKLRPTTLKSIFNGKDLTGWKVIPGHQAKFTVNDKGELCAKGGNGDLQSVGQYDDFVLQCDVFCNAEKLPKGKHVNSGVFLRCLPGEFWKGYEVQIWNGWKDDDRTKPVDYGTGGIYNRQEARKVVSTDNEWFTMTIVAHGNHIATWVNGYQTADFTDTRPTKTNARDGSWTKKGPISLQAHDPTTDLRFRNIRIVELPKEAR